MMKPKKEIKNFVSDKDFVPKEDFLPKEDFIDEDLSIHHLYGTTTGPTVPFPSKNTYKKSAKELEYERQQRQINAFDAYWSGNKAFKAGHYHEAIEKCNKAITLGYDNSYAAYLIIADSYVRLKEYAKAIPYFNKVLGENKKDPSLYLSLAKCHFETGDIIVALSNYRKAHELDKNDVDCLLCISHCFQKLNNPESAEKTLNEALYKCTSHTQTEEVTHELYLVYLSLGEKYATENNHRKATDAYQKALTLPSLSPKEKAGLYVAAGNCLNALGNYADAIKSFESALQNAPSDPYAYLGLAHIHFKQWDIDKAKYCYEKYLQYIVQDTAKERDTFISVNALARALAGIKNRSYPQALSETEKIINVRKDLAEMRKTLIPFILLKMGRYEDIIARTKPMIHETDTPQTAIVYLGVAYCRLGKYDIALQYLSSCEKEGYAHSGINGWAHKGDALFGLMQYKDAIIAYQKALTFKGPKEFVEFEEGYFEYRIKKSRELLAEKERKVSPHITIHGDHNPVNIGGNQATDDGVINRSSTSSSTFINKFCSNCGAPLKPNAKYCSACGEKIE